MPPTLSFSLGSLGFLTKFDFSAFRDILTSAFRNGVVVSLRLRFECTIMRSQARKQDGSRGGGGGGGGGKPKDLVEELLGEESDDQHTHSPDGSYEILNDVVVDRGPNASTSSLVSSSSLLALFLPSPHYRARSCHPSTSIPFSHPSSY